MPNETRTALITGCSTGSLGSALALALNERGVQVVASGRSSSNIEEIEKAGIQYVTMDVLNDASIQSCVIEVSKLTNGEIDMLINSVGGGHYMPFTDLEIDDVRRLFNINVFSYLAVTQAFLPLLMKGKSASPSGKQGLLVNNTSISSVLRTPFHSAYSASKAAMAAFNDTQRVELSPFGIKVIDVKTGSVESNFGKNRSNPLTLPEGSLYKPIEAEVQKVITGEITESYAEDRLAWAKNVAGDLLQKHPPVQVWRGGAAGKIQLTNTLVPNTVGDRSFQTLGGLDKLEKVLKEREE